MNAHPYFATKDTNFLWQSLADRVLRQIVADLRGLLALQLSALKELGCEKATKTEPRMKTEPRPSEAVEII